jgi:hypothetical protein
MPTVRTYRAGSAIEDYCRACKTDRMHTVVAADMAGQPIRVTCGYCRSEHNFRGGPRVEATGPVAAAAPAPPSPTATGVPRPARAPTSSRDDFPLVSDRERTAPPVMLPDQPDVDLEQLLRRVIREETGLSAVTPADKWRGGTFVLRPGAPGLQEKSWPIETFFHKVVMLRNRLRTLEQQVNGSDLPDEAKVKLQAYITGCYGSLTSFNVLFADDEDTFKGNASE